MGEGAKRLYIGNLPSDITDTDLRTKFSKFGNVEGIEVKVRKDGEGNTLTTFAFLNLDTTQGNIAKCISTFSGTVWKGHSLKIQMAQESFISRLQKERQENQMKNRNDTGPHDTNKHNESATLRNFNADKFSHKDKLEKFGWNSKCPEETGEELIGKKFQKNWRLGDKNSKDNKVSVRNYNPMEILLNSISNQKGKNIHNENEAIEKGKLQTSWKSNDSSENFTVKNSDYIPLQKYLNSSNIQKNEANQSESSVMKVKPQIRTSLEKAKGKSESQHSHGIKRVARTNVQKEHNYSDFDSDNSDEETPANAKHIPVFQNTERVLASEPKKKFMKHSQAGSVNSDASSEDKTEAQRGNAGTRSSSLGLKLEEEMMKKFEAFSNSWKDSGTVDETDVGEANKSYVVQSETGKMKKSTVAQEQGGKKSKSVKTKQSEKPRMKTEKHALSDHRRIKALQVKEQVMKDQKRIIREALSAVDSGCSVNKKIVFDSEDKGTPTDHIPHDHIQTNSDDGCSNQEPVVKGRQHIHFTEDETSNEAFRVQQQLRGVKGEKLPKFASDDRFHLDERFYESNEGFKEEHLHNAKQSKLEVPYSKTSLQMKKKIFKDTSQLRYDPTKEDHEKFIMKCDKEESNKVKRKKKDKNTKKKEEPQPKVSSERYFEISNDFSTLIKSTGDKSQGANFSLLKLMGRLDKPEAEKEPEESYKVTSPAPQKQPWTTENPFRYDSSDSEQEEEAQATEEEKKDIHPTVKSFFFQKDDDRLKEGSTFFSQQSKHMKQEELLAMKTIKEMAKKVKSEKHLERGKRKYFRKMKSIK